VSNESTLVRIGPNFEFDGIDYDLQIHRVRAMTDEPRDLIVLAKRVLILFQCVHCRTIIQPLGRIYCDDTCKDRFHNWERKLGRSTR